MTINTLIKALIKRVLFFCIMAIPILNLYAKDQNRSSSAPYISGDTFRSFVDFIYDETQTSFDPQKVNKGDIIFVKGDLLKNFVHQKHDYIKNPYVLVTHNADTAMPDSFLYLLDDEKILAWYAQNIETALHPKLFHLPIGLANAYWGHGSIKDLKGAQQKSKLISKNHLLYLNINILTYRDERAFVYNKFKNTNFCLKASKKPYKAYLEDMASCKFVLSPRGNGLDCHRTWESLYMGAIPIVKTSNLDPMYKDLPVLIIKNWDEISKDFLEKTYAEMSEKKYNLEKLDASYWEKEFKRFK